MTTTHAAAPGGEYSAKPWNAVRSAVAKSIADGALDLDRLEASSRRFCDGSDAAAQNDAVVCEVQSTFSAVCCARDIVRGALYCTSES